MQITRVPPERLSNAPLVSYHWLVNHSWCTHRTTGIGRVPPERLNDALHPLYPRDYDGEGAVSEVGASMREIGMSTRAIASATGVSQKTASRELAAARESNDSPDATSLAAVLGLEVFKFESLRGV